MGVIHWLDRIDPSVWDRASRRVESLGTDLLDRRAAVAFLEEFGKTPSEHSVVSSLDDGSDEDEPDPALLNGLFEEAVTEESWELDKSPEGLGRVARLLPGGDALVRILEFEGLDVELPEICRPSDAGLFGCFSSARLADAASVARGFAAPADVAAAVRAWSPGLVGRLLGRGTRAKKALETIADDYYAGHWQTLCRAVLATSSRGHYLGFGLSG